MTKSILKFFLASIAAAMLAMQCSEPKQPEQKGYNHPGCQWDSFYENDIFYNGSLSGSFHYPPAQLPIVGKTTEAEVYDMYSYTKGPYTRNSYKEPISLTINFKKVMVDKRLIYKAFRRKEKRYQTPDGGSAYERKTSDYIDLHILLYKGVVTYFTVAHFTRNKQGNLVPGKYSNGYTSDYRAAYYPGDNYLSCMYWLKRPDALCQIGYKRTQTECDLELKNSGRYVSK